MGGNDAVQSRRAEIEVTLDHRLERSVLQLVLGLAQQPPTLHDVLDIIDAQRRQLLVEIFPVASIGQRRWYIVLMCAGVQHVPACPFHAVDKSPVAVRQRHRTRFMCALVPACVATRD